MNLLNNNMWYLVAVSLIIILSVSQVQGLKIMTVGDLACNSNSIKVMNKMLSYLQSNSIDRLIVLGDVQYSNSYYQCVRNYLLLMDQYTTVQVIRGNHEDFATWNNITSTFGEPTYEIMGDVLLVYMNTEIPYLDQYDNISSILTPTVKHKIVFMHKLGLSGTCQSINPDTRTMCGFYEKYNPMFISKAVDCVVQAHQHTMAMYERGAICYPVYGMGGADPHQTMPSYYSDKKYESSQYGYTIITTTSSSETHKFYKNNGDTKSFTFTD